jgi:hypothetical protein
MMGILGKKPQDVEQMRISSFGQLRGSKMTSEHAFQRPTQRLQISCIPTVTVTRLPLQNASFSLFLTRSIPARTNGKVIACVSCSSDGSITNDHFLFLCRISLFLSWLWSLALVTSRFHRASQFRFLGFQSSIHPSDQVHEAESPRFSSHCFLIARLCLRMVQMPLLTTISER